MDHAGFVRGGEAAPNLHGDLKGLTNPEVSAAQRLAPDQFGDNIKYAVRVTHVVNGHDVGMIERGQRARLLFESLPAQRIVRYFRGQDLEGDFTVQTGIARAIDF